MDPALAIVIAIGLVVTSIVGYRVAEGLFPEPPKPPLGPRSDFQVLTDTISDELDRLHDELTAITSSGEMYSSIVGEIGRLNQKLVDQYDKMKDAQ